MKRLSPYFVTALLFSLSIWVVGFAVVIFFVRGFR